MSYVFRKGKKGESVQIRVSKRGTKEYFTRTVHIPKGLTMREKKRFAEQEERKFENECKGGSKNVNILFRRFVVDAVFGAQGESSAKGSGAYESVQSRAGGIHHQHGQQVGRHGLSVHPI